MHEASFFCIFWTLPQEKKQQDKITTFAPPRFGLYLHNKHNVLSAVVYCIKDGKELHILHGRATLSACYNDIKTKASELVQSLNPKKNMKYSVHQQTTKHLRNNI